MVAHPSNGVYIEEAPAARISSRRHADNAAANREENQCSFHSADLHMGSSAQDGENEQYLSLFLFFWSFTVAKRFDFLKFRQLFWRDFDR